MAVPTESLLRLLGSILVAGALAGCAAETAEETAPASSEDAILGGRSEPSWPAVGMLHFESGNFGTGSLISPTMVLTAAHVAKGNPTKFYFGSPPAGQPPTLANLRSVAVAQIIIHPCYDAPKGFFCPNDGPIDVALVRLAEPIGDVAPLKVVDHSIFGFWQFVSPYIGQTCDAVGFGAYVGDDKKATFGSRRSATSRVASVGFTELATARGTGIATSGDSGGPLVCNGEIIGTVRGSAGGVIPKDASPYERVKEGYERSDLWRGWIASGGRHF